MVKDAGGRQKRAGGGFRKRFRSWRSDRPCVRWTALPLLCAAALSGGCTVVDVGVSNPLPEVRRVAVAPFINLSTEPDVDYSRETLFAGGYADRRFAQAYYAELQKVPGFEVIPVGVVDQAIHALKLPMEGPQDYLKICEAIGADAICVGAVTDWDAYQPRLGMQVQWYSLTAAVPPCPVTPHERERAVRSLYRRPKHGGGSAWPFGGGGAFAAGPPPCDEGATIRGQSPPRVAQHPVLGEAAAETPPPVELPAIEVPPASDAAGPRVGVAEVLALYSYTRLFDGRDARLTARLRDYVELSGDLRAGGWEGYLTRSDDFIRFCCHVSITEMLQLHGGESSRRIVFKKRTQK